MFISLWYSEAVKIWKKLLQFIYVNETFFKAKCSTSSFYIAACDNCTSENKPIFHIFQFSDPSLIISLAGAKTISGPRFLLFVFKHLLSIFVKNKTFMNILVRNAGNQILKLSEFTYFQILFTVLELSPLKNVNVLSIE